MDERTIGAVMVLAAAVGFGTLPIFGKFATAAGLSRTTLLLFRFLIGALVVWGFLALRREVTLLTGHAGVAAVSLGVIYSALTVGYFWGLSFLTASLTAIVFYSYPVYVVALSAAVLDEPLGARVLVSLVLALGGVALVVGADPAGADPFGIALVVGASVAMAIYITGGRVLASSISPRVLTGHILVISAAAFGFRWLQAGPHVPTGTDQWLIVLGIGVFGTGIPLVSFYEGLKRVRASHASVLGTGEPVASVAFGVTILGESLAPTTIAGGALVLAGVLLVQFGEGARARLTERVFGSASNE